jgi:hypothetical protein
MRSRRLSLGWCLWCCALLAGFSGSSPGAQSVTIGWTASASPNIAEYLLCYGTVSDAYTYTNNVGLATNATVTNLQAGTTYYFEVIDVDTVGVQSIPSGQISYSVPGLALTNPVITWTNPASIVYGTPLRASQLDATANVPGSFAYNPPAGKMLPAGSAEVLSATFTPLDTTNYNVATKTVTVNVLKAPLTVSANNESMAKGLRVPPLTASYRGFANNDTRTNLTTPVSLSTSANANSPQGTYPIIASAATSPNYAISFVNGTLTVTPPRLVSLRVTSTTNSIAVGQTQPLTATGIFSDNSTQNLTSNAVWLSSAPTVALISSPGRVLALTPGNCIITASRSNIVGTLAFTVTLTNLLRSLTITTNGIVNSKRTLPDIAQAPLVQPTDEPTVMLSAQIKIARLAGSPGGPAQFILRGPPGQVYFLEISMDLIHWKVLETGTLPAAGCVCLDQTAPQTDFRFYRVSTAR